MAPRPHSTVHFTRTGEGRYFKAYLSYLAGWRSYAPAPSFYDVDRQRARRLRAEAVAMCDSVVAPRSRFQRFRPNLKVPRNH